MQQLTRPSTFTGCQFTAEVADSISIHGRAAGDPAGLVVAEGLLGLRVRQPVVEVVDPGDQVQLRGPPDSLARGLVGITDEVRRHRHPRRQLAQHVALGAVAGQHSDELLSYYCAERDVLRELSPRVPVTTNLMVTSHQSEQDYFRWAPQLDLISQDHYLDHRLPDPHAEQAFCDDQTRAVAGGRPWMLMESATSAVNWQPVNVAKRPGELLVDSLRHVARGSDTVGFFQWRASVAGGEKYHSALVPHAGTDTTRFREVCALGAALAAIGEVAGSRVQADVALLWDWEAYWACDLPSHPSGELRYLDAPRRWHRALTELGATVDVVHPSTDLSGYRLVVVPTLYLCSQAVGTALASFVQGGGHALVTYFSGIVDESDHVRLGGYPGAFADLLGVRAEEFAPLRAGETITLDDGGRADLWTEVLIAPDAEVIARYADGPLPGTPALTRRPVGNGVAWYIGTRLDEAGTGALADRLLGESGATRPIPSQPDVEVVRRAHDDGRSYLFVLNRGTEGVTVAARGIDLLSGDQVAGSVEVAAGRAAVVREERPDRGPT